MLGEISFTGIKPFLEFLLPKFEHLKNLELDPTSKNLELEAALNLELNEWLERDELKWRQKSREL